MKGLAIAGAGFVLMLSAEGAAAHDASLGKVVTYLLIGLAVFAAGFVMMREEDGK